MDIAENQLPVVIVGAGMAAYTVAREFRKLDKERPLTIISQDAGGFYSKPMLSNAFAQNKQAQQLISQSATQMAAQLQADIQTHTTVLGLDCAQKLLNTSRGTLAYSDLVLAVGAQPIRLPLAGDAADQVLSCNHISDYAQLREKLACLPVNARVAILGGGLIGCEFADDLAGAGYQVSVIDLNPLPMALLAAPALSRGLLHALQGRGINFYLGTSAQAVRQGEGYLQLELADGRIVEADLLLSAVGLRPDLALAQQAGLRTARGIVVDAYGQTSAQHVYALGDCAEYQLDEQGNSAVLPYVAPIMAAGRAIAKTLTGQATPIDHKPAAVIVKTPSYPLALLPPPAKITGHWQDEVVDGVRTVARFVSDEQILLGFGLAPQEAGLRQKLLAGLGQSVAS